MEKIGILTSGGDSPGMNAAIRAVVRTSIYNNMEVLGIRNGFQGLIEANIFPMDISSVADIIHKGGTILGTSRSKEFMEESGLKKALNILEIYGLKKLVILGGDGSFRGALELKNKGIEVACIPCTIDNDLGYSKYSIGFFTAITTVSSAIGNIRDTSSSHGRANVVEVMGRKCGDIALYAGLSGGAESVIIPEVRYNIATVAKKAMEGRKRGKRHHIIVLAEGAGGAYDLAEELKEITNIDTKVTILGYIQRGGVPAPEDRIMGTAMGVQAVELLMQGISGIAMGIKCEEIFHMDLEEALAVEKTFNKKLYEQLNIVSI